MNGNKQEERKCVLAVKIRGTIRASRKVRETLQMLNLKRTNHATLIDNRPAFIGMLRTVQNYITWGEPSRETVKAMIKKRGRIAGNRSLTDEYALREGYRSLEELSEAVFDCSLEYWNLPKVKPVFRLHPPSNGFKGKVKKEHGTGGELGYRGEEINRLIGRMI